MINFLLLLLIRFKLDQDEKEVLKLKILSKSNKSRIVERDSEPNQSFNQNEILIEADIQSISVYETEANNDSTNETEY